MSVRQVKLGGVKRSDARLDDLEKRLIVEWKANTGSAYPDIREEVDPVGRVVHVYVIWDEWRDLDHTRRSEVITDAFLATHGQEAIIDLTVAMGLTPEEARRMGIE